MTTEVATTQVPVSTSPLKKPAVKVAKKPRTAGAKKPKPPSSHPQYTDMVSKAIQSLKEHKGSSRQALLKYIMANFKVGSDAKLVNSRIKLALKRGLKLGLFKHSKGSGASGSFRLGEKKAKAVAKKPKIGAKPKAASGAVKPKKTVAKKPKSPSKPKSAKLKKAASPKKPKTTKSPRKAKVVKHKSPKKPKVAKPKAPKKAVVKKAPGAPVSSA